MAIPDTTPDTTPEQLDAIVRTASAALPALRDASPAQRRRWLDAVAAALETRADDLVALAMEESHLLEPRLRGELARTVFQLRLLGQEGERGEILDATVDHADPGWGMGPRPDLRRMNVPLGVVAVFGASNFPFAFSVIGGDSAAALAAGCAVVHKGHDAHPRLAALTAAVVGEALTGGGAPEGTLTLVVGFAAGQALVEHPLVDAVAFTGSTAAGRSLFDRIAARPRPVPFYGELGSTNPVFTTPGAWAARGEAIAGGFVDSVALGVGQFCTKPGFLFAPAGSGAVEAVRSAAASRAGGPMLSPRIEDAFRSAYAVVQAHDGLRTVVDADAPRPGVSPDAAPPIGILATTAAAVRQDPELLGREMFGPASVVVEYGESDDLVELARLLDGQLTATLHAEPDDDVTELADVLATKVGRLLWNGWPTGVSVSYAQQHGGPYPATTASSTTSVGTAAVRRFVRPVAFQDFPADRLPPALREDNPWRIRVRVDGQWRELGNTAELPPEPQGKAALPAEH